MRNTVLMKWFFALFVVNALTAAIAISQQWEPMHVILLALFQAGVVGISNLARLLHRARSRQLMFRAVFFFGLLVAALAFAIGQFFETAPLGIKETISWSQIIFALCILCAHQIIKIFRN